MTLDVGSPEGIEAFAKWVVSQRDRERYVDWVICKKTGKRYGASEFNLKFRVRAAQRGEIPWEDFHLENLRPWLDKRKDEWDYTDDDDGRYW
jgi:hypothetical protein